MADQEQARAQEGQGGESARAKAEEAKERYERAEEKIRELEQLDEPPSDLSDWPDDEAKYITYGGIEGETTYDEGPTAKLGPHDLERHEDGSISIEGEKVDNPDDYKGDPIPGGPTDPDAPTLSGEERKEAKRARQEEDPG